LNSFSYFKNNWVNELINFEGGDNYAIRLIPQNFEDTEDLYLSTNTLDFVGNTPYNNELEGIIKNGEVYQTFYSENLLDNEIDEKFSYAKLYEPYNWILVSNISYNDMYKVPTAYKNHYHSVLPIVLLLDFLLTSSACFIIYLIIRKKKANTLKVEAIRQNKFKSEFLANMSHDLRTPLASIVGLSQLAREENLDIKEMYQYLKNIDISSNYLLTLLNDVLDISAIEEGKIDIEKTEFDLKKSIFSLISMFNIRSNNSGVNFVYDCHDIEIENLIGDNFRINQVVSNLLSNAFKFTQKEGTVRLEIYQAQINKEKVRLIVVVSDNGCGIPKKFQAKIFDKFAQSDPSIKSYYGGSGLGLSIVKHLTELMHGSISLESAVSKGSTFTFSVDLNFVKPISENLTFKKNKLLIVDDEKTCRSVTNYANQLSIECISSENKLEALKIVEKDDAFDCIIINYEANNQTQALIHAINEKYPDNKPLIILSKCQEVRLPSKYDTFVTIDKPIFKSSLYSVICNGKNCLSSEIDTTPISLDGMKVLVVEDNKVNQLVTRKIVESLDVLVDIAEDGMLALQMFLKKDNDYYDLILMDSQMPVMNGLEATKKIRNSPLAYAKTVNIYSLSANNAKDDIAECYSVGMNGYISKPLNIPKFKEILSKIWAEKKQG
jgi:signal transduction histidine kinase/DNA-binding response OmpR family regulator